MKLCENCTTTQLLKNKRVFVILMHMFSKKDNTDKARTE